MSFLIGEVLEGIVAAGMFELFRRVSPDGYLEEERRYNDAMISLETRRVEWNIEQDRRQNRIDEYLLNKSEASSNERDTMARLTRLRDEHSTERPALDYQPSKEFSDFRDIATLVGGVGVGVALFKII